MLEIDVQKIRKFDDLLEIFSNNMKKLAHKEIFLIIENFSKSQLLYSLFWKEKSLIFDTFIEKLLLEKGNKGEKIKIYGITE